MNRQEATHAYVGYCPICNSCNAASVDVPNDPEWAKETAKFVSSLLRRGYRIERVTIEEARTSLKFCDHRKRKAAPRGRSPTRPWGDSVRARWRREIDQAERSNTVNQQPIERGSRVRRIDEPYVLLRVREVDSDGSFDGTPKALCFNSFGHGKWMAIADLEVVA